MAKTLTKKWNLVRTVQSLSVALVGAFALTQGQTMSLGSAALVGDIQAGERKSVSCQACHGPKGISANPIWPNLAGQQEVYLANTLRAYRSGQRKDPLMGPMAAGLSDQDIADLAAYYASLKP